VCENGVLGGILGIRDEVTGKCTKLHNEKLNGLYAAPNIARMSKWKMESSGHAARMGEVHKWFWWGNLRGRPLGRPRCR
jgi:hypothetical protein